MSSRHRNLDVAPAPRAEIRAKARRERHRISTELHQVATEVAAGGVEPDDAHDPGAAWKPVHHHDAERAKAQLATSRKRLRHWKVKAWKRRTTQRRARANAIRVAFDQS